MRFLNSLIPFALLAAAMYAMVQMGPHASPEQEDAKCKQVISTVTRSVDQIIAYPDLPGPGTTQWAEIVYVQRKTTGRWPQGGC